MKERENKTKKEKGITLVALVVTIIIIIILASVTIVGIFGENGIIRQAELAKDLATNSTIKENEDMNSLMDEYTNIMSGGEEVPEPPKDETPPTVSIQVGEITEISIEITVNATDDSGEIASFKYYLNGEEKNILSTNTYTFTGLTTGTEYEIKVEVFDEAGNKGENSTKVSTTKPNYPTVEEKLKEGDYVTFPSSKGDLNCVVLYDNSSGYGVQIVTMDTVEDITLGNSDFTTSMNLYNSAISTLNSKAAEYINDTYASDARCVGSVPNDKNHESGMHKTQFGGGYDKKFRDTDKNYQTDYNKMKTIREGIHNIGKSYCLASRIVYSYSSNAYFNVRSVNVSGDLGDYRVCWISSGGKNSYSSSSNLRPVFTLKAEIKVTGGDGLEGSPYTLGV